MSRIHSLSLAIELAQKHQEEAMKALARVRSDLAFANDQMAQLEAYAIDTDSRWTHAPNGALSAEMIRHHYQFMGRLQHAIRLQVDVISEVQCRIDLAKKNLVEKEIRLAALGQVLESRRDVLALAKKRHEQRVTDEFAAMAFGRKIAQAQKGDYP
jgi:flagellar FliJ protein